MTNGRKSTWMCWCSFELRRDCYGGREKRERVCRSRLLRDGIGEWGTRLVVDPDEREEGGGFGSTLSKG
jgi:hypothetical protein